MHTKRSSLGLHFLSSHKRQELQELFNTFDKDGDGKISPDELADMLQSTGMSANSAPKSSLSFEEFAVLMRPTLHEPLRLTKRQQELREVFDTFDRDGDGFINAEELSTMMKKLGDNVTPEEAVLIIKDADHNNDGVIDFNEFSVMMNVPPPQPLTEKPSTSSHGQHRHRHRFSFSKLFRRPPHSGDTN